MGVLARELFKIFRLDPPLGSDMWMLGVSGSHCCCRKPPVWVTQRCCSWPSAQFWSLGPCSPAWHQGPACQCSECVGRACRQGLLLLLLSNQGCPQWLPGTVAPRGTQLICVSEHPPPLEGKAPAQPLPTAAMLLCGSGHFSVTTACPSFDFLLPPSVRPVTVFTWLFVYTSHVKPS